MATKSELMRKLYANLESLYEEISVLVKKNPNETLNTFKIGLINEVLVRANSIFEEAKPLPSFTVFETDELPSASDVVIVLNVYKKAMWQAITGG